MTIRFTEDDDQAKLRQKKTSNDDKNSALALTATKNATTLRIVEPRKLAGLTIDEPMQALMVGKVM